MGSVNNFIGVVPSGCEVRFIDAQHGNGIFATKSFDKGDKIYFEKPLVSFQQSYNRQEAWTCAHCGRFLGSLDQQFAKHLGLTRLRIVSNIHLPETEQYEDARSTVEPIPCIGGCGEVYCSEACREISFSQYHHLLCVGQISSTKHPLYLFKQHALENNELFILSAQLVARIISLWLENGKQINISEFQTKFLNKFTHKLWWEMPHGDSTPEEMQRMAQESVTLLQQAFSIPFADNKSDMEQISSLFVFEFYAKLLALLETNEIAIGITSPMELYRKNMDKLNASNKVVAEKLLTPLMNKLKQIHLEECEDEEGGVAMGDNAPEESEDDNEEEEDEEAEDGEVDEDDIPIFSNYEGIGVFPFTAMMNHSCEPNCQVNFEKDSTLHISVLAPIHSGDQIMQSYIYEKAILRERQEELKPYGFVCDCPKCVRQIAAQQVPKSKQKNKQKR